MRSWIFSSTRQKTPRPRLQAEYRQKIDALLLKKKEAELKLQGISAASDDTWEEMKEGTENVWNEVRSDLHDAILKIK